MNRGVISDAIEMAFRDAPSRARRIVCDNDILISTVRPNLEHYARVKRAEPNTVASTGFSVITPKRTDPRFLYYALTAPWVTEHLARIADSHTSAYPAFNPDVLLNLRIALPEASTQAIIGDILGSLDDKIELNRRMNETLEAMARAIFKSWFVDFDPVQAKSEGCQPPGMDTATAALFPDSFQDSTLGKIPKGWEVKPLPDAIEVNPSRTLRKGEPAPYLDMANMPVRGHTPDSVLERPFGSGMRFINGDTLVARITSCLENGKTAFVDFLADGQVGWGSTEYIVLRPKPPLPCEFAYCFARGAEFREFAIQSMTGTSGRQRVPPEALSHYLFATPSESIAVQFGKVVQPLFGKASQADKESRALAALRDALLPKLMSGEIRCENATAIL